MAPTLRELLAQAQSNLDAALQMLPPDVAPGIPVVRNGGPFAQVYADAPAGATIRLAPDFMCDQPLHLTKPITLMVDGIENLPPARMTATVPLPSFLAGIDVRCPGVSLIGVEGWAVNKDANVLDDQGVGTLLDRVRLLGTTAGAHRGIVAHGQGCTYRRTYVAGIFHTIDTQAIGGWDGTRDLLVDDCYLEASGETVMFGGADSATEDRTPTGITIQNSTLTKDPAWRAIAAVTAKNLIELKNARQVNVLNNQLSNSWADGQTGFAILITVRNQNKTNPWATVQDVAITGNTITHAGGGIQLLASDDQPNVASVPMARVSFAQNVFEDINPYAWGGTGRMIQLNRGGTDLAFLGNVFHAAGGNPNSFLYFIDKARPWSGLRLEGNDFPEGAYGIFNDSGLPPGVKTLETFAPGYTWLRNTVRQTSTKRTMVYPADTTFIPLHG